MSTAGPPPLFHGIPVLVVYSNGVRNPRIVHASIHGFVRRMQDTHGTIDELLLGIHDLVAQYDGLTARLVARTPDVIEFAVSKS